MMMSWQLFWQIFLLVGWIGFVVAFVKSVKKGS